METAFGIAIIVAGIALLRLAWARSWDSARTWTGCIALLAGLILLAAADGAWGIAVGFIAAMVTAFLILARAAATSRPAKERPIREAAPTILLRPEGAKGLARRFAVFLITVPGAGVAAGLVALALQALTRAAGWLEADSTTLGLLALPVAWAALAVLLLLQTRPAAMLKPLLGTGFIAGAALWLAI